MKRCPECEFLYEDEQDRCDMDGTSLKHTATLPPLPLPQPVVPPVKSIWGGFTIPLLVLVVLGSVLVILYRATPSSLGSSSGLKKNEVVNQDSNRPTSEAPPEPAIAPAFSPEPAERSTGAQMKATKSNRPLPSTNNKAPAAGPESHIRIEPAVPTVSAPKPATIQPSASPVSEKQPANTYSISAHPKPPPASPVTQPDTKTQEKDSKFKSLLKKAGRILKKPF